MRALRWTAPALISIALFGLTLEIGLRLFPQAIPLSVLLRFDPALRSVIAARRDLARRADTVVLERDDGGPPDRMWVYRPGSTVRSMGSEEGIVSAVRADAMGFCNTDPDAYRAARFDVFALGDSFTWCTAVEARDAWPERLQTLTGLRTYNAGLPARGLHEYLQVLERFGLAKRPDFVVVAVYEGNDLRDAHRFHTWRAGPGREAGELVCAFASERICRILADLAASWAGRHSYAVNLALGGALQMAEKARTREIDFRYDVTFPDGVVLDFNSGNGDRDELEFARWLVAGKLRADLFDDALQKLVALGKAHGFVPVVVYVPSSVTAYRGAIRFEDPAIEGTLERYSQILRGYFAAQAEKLGFPYLDLTPVFQSANERLPAAQRLFFRSNVHLTPAGHQVVAEEVARRISELR
jgi:lysophospholipase L1-like esterase